MSGLIESFYGLTEKLIVYSNMFNIIGIAVLVIVVIVFLVAEYLSERRRRRKDK